MRGALLLAGRCGETTRQERREAGQGGETVNYERSIAD
jgi:hypothetical protein